LDILLGEAEGLDKLKKSNLSAQTLLNINEISPNPNQPRKNFNKEKLQELATSIKNQGLLVPIIVNKTKDKEFVIVAGERRWRASKIAGLKTINVITTDLKEEDISVAAIIENVQREDLNALEEAEAYNELIKKYNLTHLNISKKTGKSRSYITNLIRINTLPRKTKELLRSDKISFGHARALVGIENQDKIIDTIIKNHLSVRETEVLVNKEKGQGKSYVESNKDANIRDYEKYLSLKLGYKVIINDKSGKGSITIKYKNLEQLEQIVSAFND
tara:strand:- start:1579 stop:2400 length:822 start_codon:yes stop_codon:yes gene_type:complete